MDLTHMQELMETIFSNMKDAVCITTKSGIPLYTNHAAEELLGICANESEKQAIWQLLLLFHLANTDTEAFAVLCNTTTVVP